MRNSQHFTAMAEELSAVKSILDKLLRIVYVGAGIGIAFSLLSSSLGQRVIGVVFAPSVQSTQMQNSSSSNSMPAQH